MEKPADWAKPCLPGVCNVPGEAHDHGGDDGDLHGTDDGGDEDIVQLLATGDHIEDVEVQQLVALGAAIGRLAPEGRNTRTHTYTHTVKAGSQEATEDVVYIIIK